MTQCYINCNLQYGLHVHGSCSFFFLLEEFVSQSIIADGRSRSRNVRVTVIYNKVRMSMAPARFFLQEFVSQSIIAGGRYSKKALMWGSPVE